jgi:hypothetical protein
MLSRSIKASGGDGNEQAQDMLQECYSLSRALFFLIRLSRWSQPLPSRDPCVHHEVPVPVCLDLRSRPVLRL